MTEAHEKSQGRALVVQTEELDAAAAAWLRERCELVRCAVEDAGFAELLARADGLVVRTYTVVDAAMLDRAPRLRVVGRAGVGLDRIDVAACRGRGIAVVHTPAANTQAVAEYVFAMLHDATRPRAFLDAALTASDWGRTRREMTAPRQLSELTLGVWGLGKIGSIVARIGGAYGMRVMFYDLREIAPEFRNGAEPVDRETLLRGSDVLTLHVDGRASNHGLVNASVLARVKRDVVLVNTCRGFVIDTPALAEFLQQHPKASALLDVHEPEPFGAGYPLLGLANAHLSPHLAAATALAHSNMSWVVKDVWRVLQGEAAEFMAQEP